MLKGKNGALLLISGFFAFSLNANATTLRDVISQTINNSPKIKEQVHNYRATIEDIKIAKKGWLPTLDYLGGIGYEETKNSSTQFKNVNFHVYEQSLILSQNIFNGWSTTHQIKTQEARVAAASYHMIEVVNDTSFNLTRYYIEVLKSRELLKIAKENIDINKNIYTKIQKLYKAGLTTKSEREKVSASLALARSNYITQENQLRNALFQFKFYYGKSLDKNEFIEPVVDFSMPTSYKAGLDRTLKHNPSIIVQKYNIKVAKEDYKEKKSRYYPKVDIELRRSWDRNLGGVEGKDDRFRAMLTLQYNLFNGLKDKATIQKGISKINQEVQILGETKREAAQTYDLSWAAYQELQKQLKYLLEYKKYAIKTLRLYSKEFDLGRRSLLDLLSAQNDLINSKSQIVKTKYNLLFAKYRILDAEGDLVTTILKDNKPYEIKKVKDTLPKIN